MYTLRPLIWALASSVVAVFVAVWQVVPRITTPQQPAAADAAAPRRARADSELTRRELQVLNLLAQDCTYRAVGERLVISEETVRTHVKSILHKLGQPNRAGAIAAAKRDGII